MAIAVRDGVEPNTVAITFTLRSDAMGGPVSVVGSFNGWQAGADPFSEPDENGLRVAHVVLAADGPVHFRYLAAGDLWFDDADADQITENGSILLLAADRDTAAIDYAGPAQISPEEHSGEQER
jgi:hypothetical protein